MTTPRLSQRLATAALTLALGALTASVPCQTDPAVDRERVERLRAEQQEILRKTERLQALMTRLLQRYEREGKQEQIDLLNSGLAHLKDTAVLREVASIRDDLVATALSEAVRKQTKVVEELEQLIDILLDRRSAESLNQAAKTAAERAATARELEQKQRALQNRTNQTVRGELDAAQQNLLDHITDLFTNQRNEAERNASESGTRRPFLEAALERIEGLLREEQKLSGALDEEQTGAQTATKQRQFDLGALRHETRELARHVRGQGKEVELEQAADALRAAAEGTDSTALQEARRRLDTRIQDAPRIPGLTEGERSDPAWQELGEELRETRSGGTPAAREKLADLATRAAELGEQRGEETKGRNVADAKRLASGARELAKTMKAEASDNEAEAAPAKALEEAAEAFDAAGKAVEKGDVGEAQRAVERAMAAVEKARRQHQDQHPDAEQQAARMAAASSAAARELENSPRAQDAERSAAEELRAAAERLRDVAKEVDQAREQERAPSAETTSASARKHLEQAKQALSQALSGATENRQSELDAAAERQATLDDQARQTAEDMQRAAESGELSEQQAQKASASMKQARQSMQQAQKDLREGKQASAAQNQQQAADALQKAGEQVRNGGSLDDEQKQDLAEMAREQELLAEDIIRLAEMLDEKNAAAKRKLAEAAAAAQRAQQAMQRGDAEETQEQQEEARKKLDEAAEEFEEERDRYQDMRQEEMLFKMERELRSFLDKQRPITVETKKAQEIQENGRLSRPTRTKLRRLGEEEHELAGRIEFLVDGLAEEGNQVYQSVLRTNFEDLREIGDRLGSRSPDVGSFTTMLQEDVEKRSEELLAALQRERQRRDQERKEQQQQDKEESKNKLNQQRQRLVGLIADLEMLKTLLSDTGRSSRDLQLLVETGSGESISEAEAALVERLAHRHEELTKLFRRIKEEVAAATQQQDPQEQEGGGK